MAAAIGAFVWVLSNAPVPVERREEMVPGLLCVGWAATFAGLGGVLLIARGYVRRR